MNSLQSIKRIRVQRNLNDRVFEIVKDYVIRPDVLPGTRLYEEELAKEIGVSRTPVKIALNKLEHHGLVKINYNKGAFKVHLSLKEVIEIIKIRETLECLSLEMTNDFDPKLAEDLYGSIPDINSFKGPGDVSKYPEFDQQFHEKMIQMGKSEWLYTLIKNQDCVFHMLRFIALQDIERIRCSIEEHIKICNALRLNDIPLAIRYTHDNFRSSIQTMEQKNSNHPGLFR